VGFRFLDREGYVAFQKKRARSREQAAGDGHQPGVLAEARDFISLPYFFFTPLSCSI
jgi:hypothetical protein